MRLGVIADDFTGATDIASFLVQNGMSTVQVNGVPAGPLSSQADAIVVSLKSRSCAAEKAVADSLQALAWLQQQGCERFYFKYCSTFDSTAQGNIGPVTDALLAALGESQTIISPSLPVNGRTVYQGHLFVMDQLLSDSGMRHHPVTPMTDSNLLRLMEAQASGKAGLINSQTLDQGADAVRQALEELAQQGVQYVVLDALNEQHLLTQGEALRDRRLVTGGSGLAIGLARQWASAGHDSARAQAAGAPQGQRAVVLSGSCSTMTNRQVARYRQQAAAAAIDVERALHERDRYASELCDWVVQHESDALAPLLFATSDPETLQRIQQQYGAARSSEAVEQLFAAVVRELQQRGWQRFIVAGGETSGVVAQTLGIDAFHIGPVISPGVPWVRALGQPVSLALKSGNFGDENFFARAQTEFVV
ncbi:3-oxo-tetronate kinase [Erwinia sp. JH02]|uniref:3-oxo-tetronate kinase n=1 Tax=Erwinia sp. JH02 TaxID=2733394 RepID=UPI001487FBE0|nr:3-oxo-tetronate kinase [Erwinia sp. JH02]NNS06329.1 four-carbon acid sugar kinase family protein [Erwinia sp. JH02]